MSKEVEIFNEFKKLSNLCARYLNKVKPAKPKCSLTRSQAVMLAYIISQNGKTKLYQKDIEKHFSIRRSTATEQLKKLESLGLIQRHQSPTDARLKEIKLTDASLKEKYKINKNMDDFARILFNGLTDEQTTYLFDIIKKLKTNMLEAIDD